MWPPEPKLKWVTLAQCRPQSLSGLHVPKTILHELDTGWLKWSQFTRLPSVARMSYGLILTYFCGARVEDFNCLGLGYPYDVYGCGLFSLLPVWTLLSELTFWCIFSTVVLLMQQHLYIIAMHSCTTVYPDLPSWPVAPCSMSGLG